MQIDPAVYRAVFFEEAAEHLNALEAALLKLDADGRDAEAVAEAFRAAHSIKGGADAVGFPAVARFTHGLETLLDQIRVTGTAVSGGILDRLLDGSDALAAVVAAARTDGPPPAGLAGVLAKLNLPLSQAAAVGELQTFLVMVEPERVAFQAGLDPIPLLDELSRTGTVKTVALKAADLPALADLNPELCYLAWSVELETTQTAEAVADVFAFAADNLRVTVEKKTPPRPAEDETSGRFETDADNVRFARFLVERGAVQPDDIVAAFDRRRAGRPLIGRLAVEIGMMTGEDVFEALTRAEPGQLFGQTALSYRLIKESHLEQLLQIQADRTPSFRECLVAVGGISAEKLQTEQATFAATPEPTTAEPPLPAPTPSIPAGPTTLRAENAELILEFCNENDEHLETADRYLLTIDGNPTDSEALNAVYRGFHTLKGGASMLGLTAVRTLAHEAESLLNLAREGKVVLRDKALDLVFASTDALKRQIVYLRAWLADRGELATDPAFPKLLAELQAFVTPGGRPEAVPVAAESVHEEPSAADEPATPSARRSDKETVRVDKDRLDKLINSIGELVIAQSMAEEEFNELARRTGGHSHALTELSKISRDIQELGLSLRMVPLQGIFQKMARLVRDLSRKMHKPVAFETHGDETELDKTVVDQLGDPLMHMVRNAIDHGLESSEERGTVGKPEEGRVGLKAYHQGGSVYIELADDGKGLDRDRILKKAVEKGIVAEDQRLSDAEIYALIFQPGFSTAKAVTDVSGRGVGMDVVRRNVELLQGSIHIRTVLGKGTTFTIRLPLTLAIMDGLLVGLGDEVFILPLLSVIESFRPRRPDLHTVAGKAELVTVRGETVPLLRLNHLLKCPGKVADPCLGLLVLVEDQGNKYALLIDDLLGQMQAVVKSLDTNYRPIEGVAGATILGNGRVAMILDVHGLAALHGQTGYRAESLPTPLPATALGRPDDGDLQ